MKLTFKIVLDKRYQKEDNSHPLKLRVYQGEKYSEKSIGIFIPSQYWDETNQVILAIDKSHELYNVKIQSLKSKIQKQILLVDLNDERGIQCVNRLN